MKQLESFHSLGIGRFSRPRPSQGERFALSLFQNVAKTVPAYKEFLSGKGVLPQNIKDMESFRRNVPFVDKNNYLRQYPFDKLVVNGDIFVNDMVSVSSGSTGAPFFWPRGREQDIEGGRLHESIYRDIFECNKQSTLVIVCFSMGTWIAGTYTLASTLEVAKKGYKLHVITPGLEKSEILRAIKEIGGYYNQIILAGYPPFLKDIIDAGRANGVYWRKFSHVRLLCAGELISEKWRDYMYRRIGSKDPVKDCISIYGSADAAMLGNETPLSILIRRLYSRDRRASHEMFGGTIVPTLVQYDPAYRYFETTDNGDLLLTANAGIPLVRYRIGDAGNVLTFDQLIAPIKSAFHKELASRPGMDMSKWSHLPFVFVHGRKDLTATLYAVNIYPENIKLGLLDNSVKHFVSGKFVMQTKQRRNMDQYLEIVVQLKSGAKPSNALKGKIEETISASLKKHNAEYKKLYMAIAGKASPVIKLAPFDSTVFIIGAKHRWVKKNIASVKE